jgi:hypothetical protein
MGPSARNDRDRSHGRAIVGVGRRRRARVRRAARENARRERRGGERREETRSRSSLPVLLLPSSLALAPRSSPTHDQAGLDGIEGSRRARRAAAIGGAIQRGAGRRVREEKKGEEGGHALSVRPSFSRPLARVSAPLRHNEAPLRPATCVRKVSRATRTITQAAWRRARAGGEGEAAALFPLQKARTSACAPAGHRAGGACWPRWPS